MRGMGRCKSKYTTGGGYTFNCEVDDHTDEDGYALDHCVHGVGGRIVWMWSDDEADHNGA